MFLIHSENRAVLCPVSTSQNVYRGPFAARFFTLRLTAPGAPFLTPGADYP